MRLEGTRVVLRPFLPEEVDRVWEARMGLGKREQPVLPDRERLRRQLERSGRLMNGELDLAIEAEGSLVGQIQTFRAPSGPMPNGVFETGIVLFDPASRGKGYGTEAVLLLGDWLFRRAGAREVRAATEPDNVAMRRVLEKLGFSFRQVIHVHGRHYALYAVTKDRWRGPA